MVINQEKDLEQTHICIGGPGISQASPLRYASYVLNTALGGGMSSRLFQEVRERRGRVYSIYSFMSSFIDCGYFGIYAGTNPEWVEEVLEVTLGEVNKIARNGLTDEELARAKSQLKGNMLLGMESTESRMNRLARNEIYFRPRHPARRAGAARSTRSPTTRCSSWRQTSFLSDKMALVLLGDLKGHKFGPDVFPNSGFSSKFSSARVSPHVVGASSTGPFRSSFPRLMRAVGSDPPLKWRAGGGVI